MSNENVGEVSSGPRDLMADFSKCFPKLSSKIIFPPKTVIFSKGDESDGLYIIKRGRAKAIAENSRGKMVTLAEFFSGDFFGEFSLLDNRPRSSTIITEDRTEVMFISKRAFKDSLVLQPEIAFQLLKILVSKVRSATTQIEKLVFLDVNKRFLDFLAETVEPRDNRMVLPAKFTHSEIASRIGASREMVTKLIKKLARQGILSVERRRIILHQLPDQIQEPPQSRKTSGPPILS